MIKKISNITFNNFYFCIFYIFTSFTFVTAFKNIPYMNILAKVALIWGILLSINNLYIMFKRKPYSIEWFILLLLFISLMLNLLSYPNIKNMTYWLVNLILLSAVFFVNKENTIAILKKELLIISNFFVALTFIFSSISFVLIILNKTLFTIQGAKGFFENENALGISAALSFIITLYLIISSSSKKLKILYLINLLIQIPIILISGARSALFSLIVLIGVFIFIKLKNIILRIIFLSIPCICAIITFTLKEDFLSTLTSGRNELWTSAIVVIKNNFLFGIGNLDLVRQVSEARYIYLPGINLGGLHNIYLEVFTANGIFAFISLLVFILISLFHLFNRITVLKSKEDVKFYLLSSLIVSILTINFFESTLLYIISFISIIFWTYLGYTLSILEAEKRDEL